MSKKSYTVHLLRWEHGCVGYVLPTGPRSGGSLESPPSPSPSSTHSSYSTSPPYPSLSSQSLAPSSPPSPSPFTANATASHSLPSTSDDDLRPISVRGRGKGRRIVKWLDDVDVVERVSSTRESSPVPFAASSDRSEARERGKGWRARGMHREEDEDSLTETQSSESVITVLLDYRLGSNIASFSNSN